MLSEVSGRTITDREVDEDDGIMTMIGPAVRAGIFEQHTDDLERVLGHPSTSLRAAVSRCAEERTLAVRSSGASAPPAVAEGRDADGPSIGPALASVLHHIA